MTSSVLGFAGARKFLAFCLALPSLVLGCAGDGLSLPGDDTGKILGKQRGSADPITGQRSSSIVTIQREIAYAEALKKHVLTAYSRQGIDIDSDPGRITQLRDVFRRIVEVSHVGEYPWEFFYVDSPEMSAFGIGGGKLFLCEGIWTQFALSEEEIGCLLAHEIAHMTSRHLPESRLWANREGHFTDRISGKLYPVPYSTAQEDEAERVGLLYAALAGYDPMALPRMWERAAPALPVLSEGEGSGAEGLTAQPPSGSYSYDHSVGADRTAKATRLATLALKYYKGPRVKNAEYKEILIDNLLVPLARASVSQRTDLPMVYLDARLREDWLKSQAAQAGIPAQPGDFEKTLQYLDVEMRQRGLRKYICQSCSEKLWTRPGTSAPCPSCRITLRFPKEAPP